MRDETVLGVALKASQRRSSTTVQLSVQGNLPSIGSFGENSELLKLVQWINPELIAIGCPLSLPAGLHCLEPSCSCKMQFPERKGRVAEQRLLEVGIPCFVINKSCPANIRPFIYRGIKLSNELRKLGHSVIEVYPSATKLILFGDSAPPKRATSAYLNYLKRELPSLIPGLEPFVQHGLSLGVYEALLNSYTAVLHLRGETLSMGDSQEGLIIVPEHGKNPIFTAR